MMGSETFLSFVCCTVAMVFVWTNGFLVGSWYPKKNVMKISDLLPGFDCF